MIQCQCALLMEPTHNLMANFWEDNASFSHYKLQDLVWGTQGRYLPISFIQWNNLMTTPINRLSILYPWRVTLEGRKNCYIDQSDIHYRVPNTMNMFSLFTIQRKVPFLNIVDLFKDVGLYHSPPYFVPAGQYGGPPTTGGPPTGKKQYWHLQY